MRWVTNSFLLLLLVACCAACSSSSKKGTPMGSVSGGGDDGGTDLKCIDKDHDTYGFNCLHPHDCDDNDPDITDECRRCVRPNDNCPCSVGSMPVTCKPADRQGDGGVFRCKEGNRYCRDGLWSTCEEAGNYVFYKDGQ